MGRQIATPSRFALLIYGKTPPIAAAAAAAAGLIRASHQLSPDSISSSDESGMSHVPCVNHLLACLDACKRVREGHRHHLKGTSKRFIKNHLIHQQPTTSLA